MNQPESSSEQTPTPSTSSCLDRLVFVLVWLWIVLVVAGRLASQIVASSAVSMIPDSLWALFPGIQGLLLLLPLLPLGLLWRAEPWRSIYRTWLYAAFYVLLLAPISLIFPGATQMQALLNILLSLLAVFVLRAIFRRQIKGAERPGREYQVYWIAILVAAIFGIPWVLWGALGSVLDILLGVLSGLAFGLASAAGLDLILLRGYPADKLSPFRLILYIGFTAGVALFILASGVGYPFGGMQLLMVICLPPLGWLAVYLSQSAYPSAHQESGRDSKARLSWRASLPAALMLGLAAAFPLTWIDPDELALVITASTGEILTWALAAAAASASVAWLSAVILLVRLRMAGSSEESQPGGNRSVLWGVALLAWLVLLAVYIFAGQPGFYGERVFVILRDQADLSSIRQIPDPNQRREQVYRTLVDHADQTQAALRQDLQRFGIEYTPYYLVNGLEVQAGPLLQIWLEGRPQVDRVIYNPVMRPLPQRPPIASGTQAKPAQPEWNLTQIHANRVWQELGVTGEGVIIGQSDSGVQYDHPELADSYHGWDGTGSYEHDYNWFDPWNGTSAPVDIGGHGTHTLGSVLGNSTGVAPGAQWIACANLARNLGNPARYLDCMQFMLAPFPLGGDPLTDGEPARGADVLNNSWGCPEIEGCDMQSLQPAVDALDAAGLFVVASAGNDGPFCGSLDYPPAIYQNVFTVGASDASGNLVIFSSRGPISFGDWVKPNIVAPGDQVLSSLPQSTYGTLSGTSMAGPHVAGTVALMWSANPGLIGDNARTRQILAQSAQPLESYPTDCPGAQDVPSTAIGYGLLDAYTAVRAALETP